MSETDQTLQQIEGKYEILEKIREGGMGAVYRVRHRILDQVRVVKVMRSQLKGSDTLRQRFLQEAKTAIRLKHTNIAQLYDCAFDSAGNAFMVMEYIDGVSLEDVIDDKGPPSVQLALEISIQALDAIGYLHRKGIIHRDISPDNLMIARDEYGRPWVKLIDLGVAKVLKGNVSHTEAGVFLGKISYASPEQLGNRPEQPVEKRSDLYSFGVVLYEILTGRHPIGGEDAGSVIAGHLMRPPVAFATSDPRGRVSEPLRQAVLRALEKEIGKRYADATEFRAVLKGLRGEADLEKDEFEAWMKPTSKLPTQKIRRSDLTSAQKRLNRQFGMKSKTHPDPRSPGHGTKKRQKTVPRMNLGGHVEAVRGPTEVAAGGPPLPPPAADAPRPEGARNRVQSQVRALLGGAEKLIELEQLDDAETQLRAVLELDGDNADARARLESIETLRSTRRAERISEVVARADSLVETGDLDAAVDAIDEAARRHGEDGALDEARSRVEGERRRRVRQAAGARLDEARDLMADELWSPALKEIDQALTIDPESTDALQMRQQIADAKRQHEEEAQRARALSGVVASVNDLIEGNEYSTAMAAVRQAVQEHGEAEDLTALGARVAEARGRCLQTILGKARDRLEAGEYEAALEILKAAETIDPEDPAVLDLRSAAREGLAERERERQRKQALREAEDVIRAHFENRDFTAAARLLDETEASSGEVNLLAELRQELGELESRDREERVSALCRESTQLVREHHYPEAIAKLEEARRVDPESATVLTLLEAARDAGKRREQELQRARAVVEAIDQIDSLIEAQELDQASTRLDEIVGELGDNDEFKRLRSWIEDEQAALKERFETLRAHLAEARSLRAEKDYSGALEKLAEAGALVPGHEDVDSLRQEIETEQRRHTKIQEVDRLLTDGDLEAAVGALDGALAEFPDDDELAALERKLGLAVGRLEVESAIQGKDFEVAERRLQELVDRFGTEDILVELRGTLLETERHDREERSAAFRQEAEEAVKSERFDLAIQGLEKSLALLPDDAALKARVEELRSEVTSREEEQQRRFRQLVDEARECCRSSDFEAARDRLGQAEALQPESDEVGALKQEIDVGEKVHLAAKGVEGLLEGHDLPGAERELVSAESHFGEVPLLGELRTQLEEKRQELVDQEIETLLASAREQMAAGDLKVARNIASEALALDKDRPATSNMIVKIEEEIERKTEKDRKRRSLDADIEFIEFMIAADNFFEAGQRIKVARERVGEVAELTELEKRLEQSAAERKERGRRIQTVVEKVQELIRTGDPEAACSELDCVDGTDAGHPLIVALKEDIVKTLGRREEEEHRKQQIADAADSIDEMIENGDVDGAHKAVQDALVEYGAVTVIEDLDSRVREIRRVEVEKQLSDLVDEARREAEGGDLDKAVAVCEQAVALDSEHVAAAELLVALHEKVGDQHQRDAARTAAMADLEAVDWLLQQGRLGEAAESMSAIVEGLDESVLGQEVMGKAGELQEQIAKLVDEVAVSIRDARGHIGNEEHQQAYEALRKASLVDPENAEVKELFDEVGKVLREQAKQRRQERREASQATAGEPTEGESPEASGEQPDVEAAAPPLVDAPPLPEPDGVGAEALRDLSEDETPAQPSPPAPPSLPDRDLVLEVRRDDSGAMPAAMLEEADLQRADTDTNDVSAGSFLLPAEPFTYPLAWAPGNLPHLEVPWDLAPVAEGGSVWRVPITLRASRVEDGLELCVLEALADRNRLSLDVATVEIRAKVERVGAGAFQVRLRVFPLQEPEESAQRELKAQVRSELNRIFIQVVRQLKKTVAKHATHLASVPSESAALIEVPFASRCYVAGWLEAAVATAPRGRMEPCHRDSGKPLCEELKGLQPVHGLVAVPFEEELHFFGIDLAAAEQTLAQLVSG